MREHSIARSVRNWPKKLVGLHKTENKIDKLQQLTLILQAENAQLRGLLAEAGQRQRAQQEQVCRNLLNMGEVSCAAAGQKGEKQNIFSLIKKYAAHIEPHNMQFFIDFCAEFCSGCYSSHSYWVEDFRWRIKNGGAEAFLAELNENFLFPQELEVTANHGIERTFRFWSAREKQDYLRFGLNVVTALKKRSAYCCFGYGAALAARRDGRLILHDDDIDILFCLPKRYGAQTRQEAVAKVKIFLKDAGIETGEIFATHMHAMQPKGKSLDVFVAFEPPENSAEGGEPQQEEGESERTEKQIDWIPGPEGGLRALMLFPAQELTLEGIAVPCPRDIDAYLSALYGENWRVPDDEFHHEWREE